MKLSIYKLSWKLYLRHWIYEQFFKNSIVAFFRQNSVYGQAQVTTDIILTRQPDLLPSSNNKYRWKIYERYENIKSCIFQYQR